MHVWGVLTKQTKIWFKIELYSYNLGFRLVIQWLMTLAGKCQRHHLVFVRSVNCGYTGIKFSSGLNFNFQPSESPLMFQLFILISPMHFTVLICNRSLNKASESLSNLFTVTNSHYQSSINPVDETKFTRCFQFCFAALIRNKLRQQ